MYYLIEILPRIDSFFPMERNWFHVLHTRSLIKSRQPRAIIAVTARSTFRLELIFDTYENAWRGDRCSHQPPLSFVPRIIIQRSNIVYSKTTTFCNPQVYRFYPNDSCTFIYSIDLRKESKIKKKNLPTVSSFALICRARCNTREYVQVTGVRYRILNVTYCKQPFRPRVEREKKKDRMSLSRIFRHAYTTRDARVTRHV